MAEEGELRSLALTPTWSVATVLTLLVAVCLLVERSIHRLSHWLHRTRRNPLFEAVEKMKEEMMLLGFISLFLVASSRSISSICIPSSYFHSTFSPCTRDQVEASASLQDDPAKDPPFRRLLFSFLRSRSLQQTAFHHHSPCPSGYESFVSYEGLEQLHRFIFVMAVTHVSYSCLTMLLAIVKVHTWRKWEEEAHRAHYDTLTEVTRALTFRRQSTFVKIHDSSSSLKSNEFVVWVTCFFRQFGSSVVRGDYLTLRSGFIQNHNLNDTYDFHKYMIRSLEEEFKKIVGVSGPLWGFVIAFMLFNINGSNLYFWIAIIPISLVLIVGAKLQHVIATLSIESAGLGGSEGRLRPRDDLFWFKKPELLLELIHFVLFQNAFELASFFWFWWQFGYNSCFIRNHLAVYCRLILGFAGQFLCSYSTLPLYALVTQMGSNYKAALIPERIRQTMHGWGKAARKRRKHRRGLDESTVRTGTSTVCSLDDGDQELFDEGSYNRPRFVQIELQPSKTTNRFSAASSAHTVSTNGSSAPLLRSTTSLPASPSISNHGPQGISRSNSMPTWERTDC